MQTFQEYIVKELQDAGLTDEQVTSAVTKLYTHEKLGPKLNSLVKTATEDYNAQVGRVAAAQQQVKAVQDWYNGEGAYQGKGAKAEFDRIAAENANLNAELARLNRGLSPEMDTSKFLTKADLEAQLKEMGGRYATTIKAASRIAARHVAKFQEEPDMDAIDKIAAEQGLPLERAYEEWIKPRVKEADEAAREKWKKETREQIERDIRSNLHLPPEAKPVEQSMMFHQPPKEQIPQDIDADLLAHWNSTPGAA